MAGTTAYVVVSAIVAGASAEENRKSQSKAASAAEKANKVKQRAESIRARNERATQIQQQRVTAARVQAQGQAEGSGTSSSVAGVTGSLQSQAAANIGQINTGLAARKAVTGFEQQGADALAEGAKRVGFIQAAGSAANAYRSS